MIQVEHITKIYDGQRALDDVSFTAKEGEVVGLLGPNGAGKSTLMKILTCYIPPTEGEASVCGHSIYEEPLAVRREIGYLPEHNPLYTDMYVREFLRFAAGVYGMKHCNDRVEEMIKLVGLTPESMEEIRAVIKNAGRDKVVLLSTHIMQEVEAMCSRAIIINHGRIVSDDHLGHITSQQLTEKFHNLTL